MEEGIDDWFLSTAGEANPKWLSLPGSDEIQKVFHQNLKPLPWRAVLRHEFPYLDAAVQKHLPGCRPSPELIPESMYQYFYPSCGVDRRELTKASVAYDLAHTFGPLGSILLIALSDHFTEVIVDEPPSPHPRLRPPTEAELEAFGGQKPVWHIFYASDIKTIKLEIDVHRRWRLRMKAAIALALIDRLAIQHEWIRRAVAETRSSPPKPRVPPKPTNRVDREAWFRYKWECDRAGIKYTHENLARDLNLVPGHVRNEYAIWKSAIDESET